MRSLSLLDPTVMYVDITVSMESAASIFRDKFMGVDVVMLHRHAAMRVFIHIRRRVKESKLKLEIPCLFPELSVPAEGRPLKCSYPTMTSTEYSGSVLHQTFFKAGHPLEFLINSYANASRHN